MTGRDLEDFQRFLIKSLPAADARQRTRSAPRKFWLWRSVLSCDVLRFAPRHVDGWSGPKAHGGENATARIPEEVPGPLFVWAMRFILDSGVAVLAGRARKMTRRWEFST